MSIKFYGKSQDVCERLIETFKSGNLPEALKPIFINRSDNIPSMSWSWSNKFMQAICGTSDSRGFRQWEKAGRKVKKGAKAFHILGPCIGKSQDKETGEEKTFLFGFKSIPVFRIEDTEVVDAEKWEMAGQVDIEEENRLQEIPLYDVARAWGLNVTSYNGENSRCLGYYRHGETIALGVKNLATWCHELTHAADDKNGTITKRPGQQPDNEIVAEVGGAVLLSLMGYKQEADVGGAWEYVKKYAGDDQSKAIRKIMNLVDRICSCVDLIIKEYENVEKTKKAA